MAGEHRVVVQTRRLKYEFILRRNITVIRGDSGTGKTTLVRLLAMYVNDPNSGVDVQCDKKCVTLRGAGWLGALGTFKDTIVFIDEGAKFVHTEEFARAVKNSDNYYVIVTREPLEQLPHDIIELVYTGIAENVHLIKQGNSGVETLVKKYIQKFGGFPYYLFMGASDESIKEAILESLKTGKEITASNEGLDF